MAFRPAKEVEPRTSEQSDGEEDLSSVVDQLRSQQRRQDSPRYPGEDTTATTSRELRGWYSYSLAAEVFAVCGVGSFLPVTLEQLARENGVLWSDRNVPCYQPSSIDISNNGAKDDAGGRNSNLTKLHLLTRAATRMISRRAEAAAAAPGDNKPGRDANQCVVHYLGFEMTTASFAMYTFSAAVFIQALVLVSFSSFADYGDNRKRLLLVFGYTGAAMSMLFLLVTPGIFVVAPIMVVIAVTCLGSSFVLLNSFLPLLAKHHPPSATASASASASTADGPSTGWELGKTRDDQNTEQSMALMPVGIREVDEEEDQDGEEVSSHTTVGEAEQLQLSTKISSKGVGIGYAAGVFVQCLSILILVVMNKLVSSATTKTLPLRVVLFVTGLWWATFTIPAAIWLRERPGPPLRSENVYAQTRVRRYLAYVGFAWSSLWKTIKLVVQLKQAAMFLLAWFLISDAVATVSGTAILFARTELAMGTVPIAFLSITATMSGILGSIIWPLLSKRYKWRANRTIVACLLLMEIIPVYGMLGFIPLVQRLGFGGLQRSWEIYPLGIIHGIVMGGISSYCRSFFGLLIPPGSEVAFYALFAITDKGSSAIGPAVVGRIVDTTGHIRPAFIFLATLIAIPIPLVWIIDVDRGQQDARLLARDSK